MVTVMSGGVDLRELTDRKLVEELLQKHDIRSYFETDGLEFLLFQYEKGEILNNIRNPYDYLQFVIEGTVEIYSQREDGSRFSFGRTAGMSLLGDMEFAIGESVSLFLEARDTVLSLALPVEPFREALWEDRVFLRFLLKSVANSFADFSRIEANYGTVEERLLAYIEQLPGQTVYSVEAGARAIHCSLRQMHRGLASLLEKKQIERVEKGKYRLVK